MLIITASAAILLAQSAKDGVPDDYWQLNSEYARACLQQDWVMSADKGLLAELVQETAERLAGGLLAKIGPGKARPTGASGLGAILRAKH